MSRHDTRSQHRGSYRADVDWLGGAAAAGACVRALGEGRQVCMEVSPSVYVWYVKKVAPHRDNVSEWSKERL